ncbi:5'-nucleotidase, lipoprotein e(P4) family [Streptococcus saliviloxodontae]|uniref:5'-nucleotidase (Lipoprotein e(P4) family) n=1 Tax=Streptococcus saliviloxodontae TaxID=1349416 RepID=A0ABS2PJU2_9STRE|nr:5'-nucleotidase, lipoprotein e(P4) family [Streptococcus saliviloxodontae]MBM7635241.1 5'-nucleotidase (lipoprotein e(P4) family) [Streptococcus saliviloxodontae]
MKIRNFIALTVVTTSLVVLGACSTNSSSSTASKTQSSADKATMTYDKLSSDENTMSALWYQTSEEAKAIYLQGYSLGKLRLESWLSKASDKPYSIVLDLDETVLDNSPYQSQNVIDGSSFNASEWDEWVQKKEAKPLPGAKDFLNYANDNGVQIYYISDRTSSQVKATEENLKEQGLPVQGEDHLLFYEDGMTSKESRRQKVQESTNLILLFGDNLVDFADFSKTSTKDREQLFDSLQGEFGDKFIIFANPMYGSWETALYNGKSLDSKGKVSARHDALVGYK